MHRYTSRLHTAARQGRKDKEYRQQKTDAFHGSLLLRFEVVCGVPSPCVRPAAALGDTLDVDVGDDIAVSTQQSLRGAHLGAKGQLALGDAVASVQQVFFDGSVRWGATGAEGTFIHLAACAERILFGKLRRTKRTRIKTVATPDAEVFVVQDDPIRGEVEAINGAHGRARCVRSVHTGNGDGFLAALSVLKGDHVPAVDAPRNVVLVITGGHTGIAIDTAFGVTEKLHSCHGLPPSMPA